MKSVNALIWTLTTLGAVNAAIVPDHQIPIIVEESTSISSSDFESEEAAAAAAAALLAKGLEVYGIEDPTEKRLVLYETSGGKLKVESIQEIDKFRLMREGIRFEDITQYWDQYIELIQDDENNGKKDIFTTMEESTDFKINSKLEFKRYKYPNASDFHEKDVHSLMKDIDTSFIFDELSNFTSFYTRYYKSSTGMESQLWLYEQILSLIPESYYEFTEVTLFDHKSWKQNSIIVTIYGENAVRDDKTGQYTDKGPVVVLGSHQDSANAIFPKYLSAPGADDDGSGSITVLETLRIIMKNEIKFKNTVEFHFYSAEEAGLLGSLDIFNSYKAANIEVIAMLQQDMTGFVAKSIKNNEPEHLGVTTDYTSDLLFDFIIDIIEAYCLIPAKATKCGYACSDHSSAIQNGYPAIMVIESAFKFTDPYIHSTSDTIDKLSMTHIAENVKMDLGYLYELGQWDKIETLGTMKVNMSSFAFKARQIFYSHFDAICWFMVVWCALTVIVLVKLIQDAGIKRKLRNLLLRRKYHFLGSL